MPKQVCLRHEAQSLRAQECPPSRRAFPVRFRLDSGDRRRGWRPLDALVLMDEPAFCGCLIESRLVGVIEAEQSEDGKTERNDRLIAVAAKSPTHAEIW